MFSPSACKRRVTNGWGAVVVLGIVDLRYLTLDLSLAALFYYWTVRIVEARRWL